MKKKIANWGNYPIMESNEVEFRSINELKQIVRTIKSAIARGNGRCYGDASLSDVTISTLKFDKILFFDKSNGVFECQSGVTLDHILEVIVPEGWFLPVTPGAKFVTIGGVVASDVHGKNHHVNGAFSRHIIELSLMLSNGEIITCHKNENAELFEANKHYTYSVAWIDCLKKGKGFGRSVLMLGEHAQQTELSVEQKVKGALALPKKKSINFPINLPSFVLNNFTVRLFNFLFYHKNFKKEKNSIIPYEPFFYPLDTILHWKRGYGKKGFVQYQFVVPTENKEGLITILKKISEKGWGSFLAVLKTFGEQNDLISFPIAGYTLALDFPVRKFV